ncbi:hypothetical protein ACOZB4_17955 [Paenibacillus sp. NPDC058898]|uniref:hypothetical protein n=1 Tax=Paenibacillus sp. NPDC058898 TaxID=3346669 RepID=UPI003BF4FD03
MKFKRISILLSLIVVFMLVTPLSAFAQTSDLPESDLNSLPKELAAALELGNNTVVISDKEQIEKLSLEDRSLYQEGKLPIRIEYEYVAMPDIENENNPISPLALRVINVRDQGHGWYDPSSDMYKEFVIDGPDTFVISESTKKITTVFNSLGVSYSAINAATNFTIGKEELVTFTSNTPVKAGERLHAQCYTTYHKKTFDVYDETSSGGGTTGTYVGSGEAVRPTGTFIKKTFY